MKKVIILICLFSSAVLSVFAQTLDLEKARSLALANSRSLAQYNMDIRSSILDERNQLYSMLPSISAEYNFSATYLNSEWGWENPVDTFKVGPLVFSVTQILFQGGKSFVQKAIMAIATEKVRKNALAEYFSVIDSADNAYYAVLEAAATLEAEESSLQTAVMSLSIAEIRQSSGMINQGDYLKALAERESRANSLNQARRSLSLSMAKLKTLTGLSGTVELAQIDFGAYEDVLLRLSGISDEEADALFDELWKLFVSSNPSLAKAALNSKEAEKKLSLARRDFSPTVSATIFSTNMNYSNVKGFESSAAGGFSIRGSIPVDFWVMSNRIEKSKIARDSAALDYISAESSLETELQTALLNTFAQAGSVLSSRRSLQYTEKHLEYVMERYRLSQSSVSDLGEASSLFITSRNNLIRATYGFLQSLSKLRSLGALDDEDKLLKLLLADF
jgi:outer membrane protein TolC